MLLDVLLLPGSSGDSIVDCCGCDDGVVFSIGVAAEEEAEVLPLLEELTMTRPWRAIPVPEKK